MNHADLEAILELAKSLARRQSEYVDHHLTVRADGEALDAAQALDELVAEVRRLQSVAERMAATAREYDPSRICGCRFENDNPVRWCAFHSEMRDQLRALISYGGLVWHKGD